MSRKQRHENQVVEALKRAQADHDAACSYIMAGFAFDYPHSALLHFNTSPNLARGDGNMFYRQPNELVAIKYLGQSRDLDKERGSVTHYADGMTEIQAPSGPGGPLITTLMPTSLHDEMVKHPDIIKFAKEQRHG